MTKNQMLRLESIFEEIGETPKRQTCEGIKGIVKEADKIIEGKGRDVVKDAALIGAAQRVEHYEIASYGTMRNFAVRLGYGDVAKKLQATLDEEKATDRLLTRSPTTS